MFVYTIKRLSVLLLAFLLIPNLLSGQIFSHDANHTTRPARYSLDSLEVLDSVFTQAGDTLLYYPKTRVLDFNDSTLVTLIEDSVFTTTQAYYVKENVQRIDGFSDTIFYITSADTVYTYKQYDYFYHDPVFIFNLPEGTADTNRGSLYVKPPYAGNWVYAWLRYDTSVAEKWTPFASGDSLLENLESGAYKAQLNNNDTGDDTAFVAWVHNNDLRFQLDLMKALGDTIDRSRFYCGMIFFDGAVRLDSFFYYDYRNNDSAYWLRDTVHISWDSKCESVEQPNGYTEDEYVNKMTTMNRVNFNHRNPLPQNTWYYATARDVFGCERTDQLFYRSIETEARMTISHRAADEETWTVAGKPEGSAPVRVLFVNESLNAGSQEWISGDEHQYDQSIEFLGETDGQPFDHYYIYYVPDEYLPILITKTPEECTDTFKFEDQVIVVPSEIDIPNVFTPNEDGINDVFTIYNQSLREFEIMIFNRWGKRVYQYEGNINEWDGWNGYVKESGREAMPGEYYYVITAKGWEHDPPVEYKTKDHTGSFYLYR